MLESKKISQICSTHNTVENVRKQCKLKNAQEQKNLSQIKNKHKNKVLDKVGDIKKCNQQLKHPKNSDKEQKKKTKQKTKKTNKRQW